jgi:DNA-binding MarR family transcriptional regulator
VAVATRPDEGQPLWEQVAGFERLLEHRTRLGVCVLLKRHECLSFTRLRHLLVETDGSLGANLAKLEEAGFLSVEKTFENRRPTTWYRLTAAGGRALGGHLTALERLVSAASLPESEENDR